MAERGHWLCSGGIQLCLPAFLSAIQLVGLVDSRCSCQLFLQQVGLWLTKVGRTLVWGPALGNLHSPSSLVRLCPGTSWILQVGTRSVKIWVLVVGSPFSVTIGFPVVDPTGSPASPSCGAGWMSSYCSPPSGRTAPPWRRGAVSM